MNSSQSSSTQFSLLSPPLTHSITSGLPTPISSFFSSLLLSSPSLLINTLSSFYSHNSSHPLLTPCAMMPNHNTPIQYILQSTSRELISSFLSFLPLIKNNMNASDYENIISLIASKLLDCNKTNVHVELTTNTNNICTYPLLDPLPSPLPPFPFLPYLPPSSILSPDSLSFIHSIFLTLLSFHAGQFLVVTDSVNRENEGDLIQHASYANSANTTFLINETSGVVCVALSHSRCDLLKLPLMVSENDNEDNYQTAFTVSVDRCHPSITTGISPHDRSLTLQHFADGNAVPSDFTRPGHIFPLRAKNGGVLQRGGHTESGYDLCRLCGMIEAAALSEIVKSDGSMGRPGELKEYGKEKGLRVLEIAELIRFRKEFIPKWEEYEIKQN